MNKYLQLQLHGNGSKFGNFKLFPHEIFKAEKHI